MKNMDNRPFKVNDIDGLLYLVPFLVHFSILGLFTKETHYNAAGPVIKGYQAIAMRLSTLLMSAIIILSVLYRLKKTNDKTFINGLKVFFRSRFIKMIILMIMIQVLSFYYYSYLIFIVSIVIMIICTLSVKKLREELNDLM